MNDLSEDQARKKPLIYQNNITTLQTVSHEKLTWGISLGALDC